IMDGMHPMSPPNGFDTYLRKTNVTHVSALDQICNGSNRVLDRNRRIQTRGPVDIDVIHTKTGQALCHEVFDRHTSRVYSKPFTAWSPQRSKLYRQHSLVTPAANRAADQHFIVASAVEVARVDQVDAVV